MQNESVIIIKYQRVHTTIKKLQPCSYLKSCDGGVSDIVLFFQPLVPTCTFNHDFAILVAISIVWSNSHAEKARSCGHPVSELS
jgi:hypothetical protein